MKHMPHFLTLLAPGLALSLSQLCSAQLPDSNATHDGISVSPRLRSIQLDGTLFPFLYAYSGSADIDFLEVPSQNRAPFDASLGMRAGVERFASGTAGGRTHGSPFLDYNALLRLTIFSEVIRFDLFTGYVHRTSDHTLHYPPKDLLKSGAELRWKIAPHVFGLLLKVHQAHGGATGGIGIYVGWDQ